MPHEAEVRLAWLIPAWTWVDGRFVSGQAGWWGLRTRILPPHQSVLHPALLQNKRVTRGCGGKSAGREMGEGQAREEENEEEKRGGECAKRCSDRPQD